jgi:MFS family permease
MVDRHKQRGVDHDRRSSRIRGARANNLGARLHLVQRGEDPLGAAGICCLGFAAFGGFLWVNTLYLQNVRGYSALQTGLIFTPMAAMTALFGPVSGRLVAQHGPQSSLLICGTCMAAGALMLTERTPHTPLGWLLGAYTTFGVGFAMISAPTNNAALTAMPAR